MTQLLKNLRQNRNFVGLGQLTIIGSIFLLAGCSEQPASLPSAINEGAPTMSGVSAEPAQEEVSLRWTSHGIPHVKANSWEGLGYGFAHAVATNTVCVLAKELITVRGETAKYFGDAGQNINGDAFHKALLNPSKINEYLASASQENKEMDKGYAAGYNNFLEVNRGQLPASCNNADWVKPIDVNDLAKLALGSGIRYGLGRVTAEIATAAPGMELASLDTMDLFVDPDMVGSNALAFGSELTDNGRGVLLGNPHYPWHGASRFHMAHLTLPGEMDVMGVGLISTQRI
ncbi:MAG: acyl-homoserine-lactone acylase, partial [Pseudohongiellaceae bacterium]